MRPEMGRMGIGGELGIAFVVTARGGETRACLVPVICCQQSAESFARTHPFTEVVIPMPVSPPRRIVGFASCWVPLAMVFVAIGCGPSNGLDRPLNVELARKSVETAMQAWIDGKKPVDLKPDLIVGDPAWDAGRKLVSFQLVAEKERSDGSNLHIVVSREFRDGSGPGKKSEVTYIVGTSPVVSIFPH